MTAVVCVSDGGGMLFNKRRQSKDAAVIREVLALAEGRGLYVTPFSEKLFSGEGVTVCENPFSVAGEEGVVFVEDLCVADNIDRIDTLVIYRWNRAYPFDKAFDVEPSAAKMHLAECVDFIGASHEKITREIWKKC